MHRTTERRTNQLRNAIAYIRFRTGEILAGPARPTYQFRNSSRATCSAFKALVIFAVFVVVPAFARAEITLAPPITEHMLVQRGLPVHIWGKSSPAEAVS